MDSRRARAPLQPKPSDQQQAKDSHKNDSDDFMKTIPEIIDKADSSRNKAILDTLRRAGKILKSDRNSDYWTTDAGKAELIRKIEDRSRRPPSSSIHLCFIIPMQTRPC